MLPVVALVGRPNVGKSTLFNRLTRSRNALVADYPGLTRDRQYGKAEVEEHPFIVIDTGGIHGDELNGIMMVEKFIKDFEKSGLEKKMKGELIVMPILNSIWQIDDGSIGIVLVNITEEPVKVKIKLPNIQSLIANMMDNGITFRPEDMADSSQHYPLAQNTIGMLRIIDDEQLVTTVCDGDSEHGYEVDVPPLKTAVIVVGSEKKYGVHN